jgi:EAL domain-containing protein (putative c-di-GMP-specific phosphodiesterase class I)/CheY-like chemotaxis protein
MAATVLVVEDDRSIRTLVCQLLALEGIAALEAEDAAGAMNQLSAHPVDLVLLDVALPGVTGYSVLEEIRHTPALSPLPVLLLTAGGPGHLVAGLAAGADDYIAKPFAVDELIARVQAHLRARDRWRASLRPAPQFATDVLAICRDRRFGIAFQPVRHLATMEAVGFEALARFHDGQPPHGVFAAAHDSGCGVELEVAAAAAAVQAAAELPPGAWLSINLSPAALLGAESLSAAVRDCGRDVIVELTEHERVEDYPALIAAAGALGPQVCLAVDDAGAGYASLSHVVALKPALVKLDRAWVDGISADPVRQALVRGVLGVADATGSTVVAEGIERNEDLSAVQALGVGLGQGFLLGRPALSAA